MSGLLTRARSVMGRRLVRNAGWSMVGEVVRLLTQITVFVILTYLYSPDDYGTLVGALGLLWFVQPYAQLGATHLLLLRVAGDDWPLDQAVQRAISTAVTGGTLCTLVLVALQPLVLPQVDVATLLLLAGGELIAVAMIEVVSFLAVATERLRAMAVLRVTHGLARTAAAMAMLVLTDEPDLWVWALAAAGAALATAIFGLVTIAGRVPRPVLPRRDDIGEGVPLSVGFGAQKIRTSADAFLLVRLDQTVDAGIYGAANRVINIARLPTTALLHASNARLHAAGATSVRAGRDFARRATGVGLAMSSAMALSLIVGADLVVELLPPEYAETADALRLLSVLPVLGAASIFAGTALTASHLHRYRVILLMTSAALNVGLNLWWIPDHGWKGATVASIISSALYVVGVWIVLQHFVSAEQTDRERTV